MYDGLINNEMPYLEEADHADLSDFSGWILQVFLYTLGNSIW